MLISREQLFIFFLGMLLVSLAISPFFLSVSMIALGVLALIDIGLHRKGLHLDFYREGYRRLAHFRHYPEFICLTIIFLIVLAGIFQNEDTGYFITRLRIKIPFLLFPLAFISLPKLKEKQLSGIFAFFLLFMTMLSVGTLVNYLVNLQEINEALMRGTPMPTPRNHIRFSLLVVMAFIGSIWLWQSKYSYRSNAEPRIYLACGLFLLIFLHILSVKTGLVTLYSAIAVLGIRTFLRSKAKIKLIPVVLGILLLPVVAYQLSPSLKAKIQYTVFDLKMYFKGEGGLYADSGRLASMEAGLEIAAEHPVAGVGAGNLKTAMQSKLREIYPDYKDTLMPHNQFITVLAGTGSVGLGLFLFACFFPLFYRKNYRHWLILGIYAIILPLFLIESTLENAAGTAFVLFFLLTFLSVFSKTKEFESEKKGTGGALNIVWKFGKPSDERTPRQVSE